MKRITLIVLLISSNVCFAQLGTYAWFSKSKIPYYKSSRSGFDSYSMSGGAERNGFLQGYYIDKNDTKIEGEIQYNFPFIMERLLVFRANGNVTFINPKDVKGYFVDGLYRESVTLNVSMIGGAKSLETYFMFPEIQGKMSLYYYSGENPTGVQDETDISDWGSYIASYDAFINKSESEIQKFTPKTQCVRKQGEPALGTDAMVFGFANKMSGMLEECPELAEKVKTKTKEYKSSNLEKIIKEYNECVK